MLLPVAVTSLRASVKLLKSEQLPLDAKSTTITLSDQPEGCAPPPKKPLVLPPTQFIPSKDAASKSPNYVALPVVDIVR